jgi:hypothetical protein
MKNLPSVWLYNLKNFDDIVVEIKNCLSILKQNALECDFTDVEVKDQYCRDILYMKQFFERAEFIARGR